jgi:hypothetical protein
MAASRALFSAFIATTRAAMTTAAAMTPRAFF